VLNKIVAFAFVAATALPATDAFTGSNNDPLSGNWTTEAGQWQIIGNKAQAFNGGGFSMAKWTADDFNDDHYSQCVIDYGSGSAIGPAVRMDANGNGYVISAYDTGTNTADINEIHTNGTANTSIGTPFAVSVGDTLKLEVTGSSLKAYKNGVLQDTVSDGTYTTGEAGMFGYLTASCDDFQADNVSGGAASFIPGIINAPIRGGGLRAFFRY
jgi:pectate lyase